MFEKIKQEYLALAYSNIFDIVDLEQNSLCIKPTAVIPIHAMRAVSSIVTSPGKYGPKITVKMHNKNYALQMLWRYSSAQQLIMEGNVNVQHLLQLTPEQVQNLNLELRKYL